jgi:hypothetical protein
MVLWMTGIEIRLYLIPIAEPKFIKARANENPSLRFPLLAVGTEWACGSVPLAKRGEP